MKDKDILACKKEMRPIWKYKYAEDVIRWGIYKYRKDGVYPLERVKESLFNIFRSIPLDE